MTQYNKLNVKPNSQLNRLPSAKKIEPKVLFKL